MASPLGDGAAAGPPPPNFNYNVTHHGESVTDTMQQMPTVIQHGGSNHLGLLLNALKQTKMAPFTSGCGLVRRAGRDRGGPDLPHRARPDGHDGAAARQADRRGGFLRLVH